MLYYKDHNPPHIHVKYAEYKAIINIKTKEVIAGYIPETAFKLVSKWINIHENEIIECWKKLKIDQKPSTIKPLE